MKISGKNLLKLWQGTGKKEEQQADRSHEGQSNEPAKQQNRQNVTK